MTDTLTDPLLGRLVDDRYEVRERVASGGMATVYLAFDRRLERAVALKVMHTNLADDADSREFVARFRREAKAAARLTHPGMVRVYDQGVDADVSYLTMEFVDGENLRQRMSHEGTLSVGEALTITESVLDALAAAHRLGLVHRDVKPENVLMDDEGRPKLADFGLARAVTEVTSTSSGVIMGTVAYLGPELVSRGMSDVRTDVYAVGILLFEMVTGRQPFTAPSAIEVAERHVHEDIPAPSSFAAWLPTEFDELVASLAARDPDMRPANAAAALAAVRHTRALMDDPTLDRKAEPPSGAIALVDDDQDATTVLNATTSGSTIALPIGLGRQFPAVGGPPETGELITLPDPSAGPRRGKGWWWAGAAIGAALFGVLVLWWYNAVGPGAYTAIPDVGGVTQTVAESTMRGVGLEVTTTTAFDDVIAEGLVVGTDPSGGTRVPNGDTVTLVVSKGPLMLDVPKLAGAKASDAEETIAKSGFPAGETTTKYSDTVAAGVVISSTPAAGESVRHDTPIDLVVSDGPAPVTIPDVVGVKESAARKALEDLGLRVSIVHERTDTAPKDEVFRQDPGAGVEGTRTQNVTLYVSDGPPLITVRDYVGGDVKDAERAARADGLKPSLYPKWPWSTKNSIVDQSLYPGAQVERGSDIVLIYN